MGGVEGGLISIHRWRCIAPVIPELHAIFPGSWFLVPGSWFLRSGEPCKAQQIMASGVLRKEHLRMALLLHTSSSLSGISNG